MPPSLGRVTFLQQHQSSLLSDPFFSCSIRTCPARLTMPQDHDQRSKGFGGINGYTSQMAATGVQCFRHWDLRLEACSKQGFRSIPSTQSEVLVYCIYCRGH